MTTIAYRDGVLAADTLITAGGERAGYGVKIRRLGPLLYGSAGSCCLGDRHEAWLRAGAKGEAPPLKDGDESASVYVFMPDDQVLWFHSTGMTPLRAPFWAAGSGESFARGAMEMGASAEQAVAVACKWDTGSGGPITVLRR